ncbi:TMV resistance protein N-like [Dorcoceras hygrometricum]|uniref:TMV resistance protein N-like n=1 Tax=Dorcoceras hygrometricum TaxID=472368 RepID=A0A2Z7CI17_9LAMI|nr:TMV resistance protein N-like [Dorcoceras hygrometricum]
MRIRPPELETSNCDAKYHVSLSTRSVLGKWVYLVTLAMSLFDLQDVCIVIGSIATLDLPMVVDLIRIYVLKGPYCTLTTTNWFLQALSVIPRGSCHDVARRFTMIRWASLLVQDDEGVSLSVVDLIDESTVAYREEPVFLLIGGSLNPVVDLIGGSTAVYREEPVFLINLVGARRLDASKVAIYEHPMLIGGSLNPVVDLIGGSTAVYREEPVFLINLVGARRLDASKAPPPFYLTHGRPPPRHRCASTTPPPSVCRVIGLVSITATSSFCPCQSPSDLLVQIDGGILIPIVDLIRRIYRRLQFKSQFPCDSGWSQAPRRQQARLPGAAACVGTTARALARIKSRDGQKVAGRRLLDSSTAAGVAPCLARGDHGHRAHACTM